MSKLPITKNGLIKLEQEIKRLKNVERPKIIEAISRAREFGDLSENAEYHAAREKQSFNEGRINELEDKLARSEVIDITKLTNDTVKFGATVDVEDYDTGEKMTYTIVSEYEADVSLHRISINSPIAKALIGKKVGDLVEVVTPKTNKAYKILAINYLELTF